ncbi:MAG: biotin--[acetyl-CoA-carboxylase] ligase [Armatimonadota bacterium]
MISARIHRCNTVESTNDIALDMARRGEPEGTVVTALAQTKGRGRRGRTWLDRPGQNALMSVVLIPDKNPAQLRELSFVAGVGVADYLALDHGIECSLKWPNDALVDDKKIAGILVEAVKVSDKWCAVAGIGLNVNQSEFDDELCNRATSIALKTGNQSSVDDTCERLAARVLEAYEQYISNGFDEILDRWRKRMWGIGLLVEVATQDRSIIGSIDGVDATGALMVRDALGNQHGIHAADSISQHYLL